MMYKKKNLLLVFLCLGIISLAAQTVDLGGEDTAVGPLLPPANSQVYDPTPWATAYSQDGNVNITDPGVHVGNKYIYALTDRPGGIIDYNELNIIFYLEDYVAFQEYFLHRAYDKKKANPVDVDIITSYYPLVREHLAGTFSYADNPRHLPMIKSGLDPEYSDSFNDAAIVRSLYELALEMPATPTTIPRFLFDESRSLFDKLVPDVIEELDEDIQAMMMSEYVKINPRASQTSGIQIESWSESDLATVVSEVSQTAVKKKEKKVIKELASSMLEKLNALQNDQDALSAAYAFHSELLSKQEKSWFEWVIRNSNQITEDLSVTHTYLRGVSELSTKETNYAHFFNITLLLRETLMRVRELPKEADAELVLEQFTATYLEKVKADMVTFEEK